MKSTNRNRQKLPVTLLAIPSKSFDILTQTPAQPAGKTKNVKFEIETVKKLTSVFGGLVASQANPVYGRFTATKLVPGVAMCANNLRRGTARIDRRTPLAMARLRDVSTKSNRSSELNPFCFRKSRS